MDEQKSLFKNILYNAVKTFSSLIFPVITFGYASRILGEAGIGKVSFVKSFMSYFIKLAMLGMDYYGTREAAKLRGDRDTLSQFTQEMLLINSCTTFFAWALSLLVFFTVPRLKSYGWIYLINTLSIPMQGLGMEWLYQALEEYRYVAVRSVIFQVVALVIMIIFVRKPDDILVYAVISLFASSGRYIINFISVHKYVSLKKRPRYEIKKHLKPLLWLFALTVSIELYTVLDSTMLGFLQGDAAVGRYTAAIKVPRVVNSLIASFSVVMIPRLSYYIGKNEDAKVRGLVNRAYNLAFLLSVPAAVGLFMLSDEIIQLLSGEKFVSSGITMRIMTPIVVFIPFSMATSQQTFVPMKKEKYILMATMTGAVTNFVCNSILIPRYAENGAAVATVVAELAVALVCLKNANKFFNMREIFKDFYKYCIAAAFIPLIIWVIRRVVDNSYIQLILSVVMSTAVYFLSLLLLRCTFFHEIVGIIREKMFHKK